MCVLLPLAALIASAGCQKLNDASPWADERTPAPDMNSPGSDYAEQRLNFRLSRIRYDVAFATEAEAQRPQRLARTAELLAVTRPRHDVERLRANVQEAGRLIRQDCQRWQERQPLYWEEALRILYGKPEHIEHNAITLFF